MADNALKKGRYTKYSNKIGLYSNSRGSFVKNDTSVVLNFPFKDAVLEAGMSKEDVGREERFLHLELDSKDIDTLEEPKVLTNFLYVDKDGEKALTDDSDVEFFDEDGKLKQNLLIKGNNLLALHTLKSRLAGQVKLIYIDPPYNTGGDGFKYNDKFNHSAWLAFMKNRLEVAKDLLCDDGAIFVQCDDNEQAYLKVLMDEVFGSDNFRNVIKWRKVLSAKAQSINLSSVSEYILVFSKTEDFAFNEYYLETNSEKDGVNYRHVEETTGRVYRLSDFTQKGQGEPKMFGDKLLAPPQGKHWIWSQEKINEAMGRGLLIFSKNGIPSVKRYLDEKAGIPLSDLWDDDATKIISAMDAQRVSNFDGQKPEGLIQRVIEISTSEGDIVLDYHLGTGTTSSVALKMNRRWVGIEQMDYIEGIAKERLEKVVAGDQTGISKSVDWSGGGSFVYFELKKYNQEYLERIIEATSLSELEDLYVDMRNNAFLKFWFDRHAFEKDEDFRKLDLDGRKKALADVLDENQLYLNYADIGDTRHNVTADEKKLTDKFYGSNQN